RLHSPRSATVADERPRARPIQVPRPERQIAFRTGISAESRAAAFLIAKGFRILARRWKSPVGEIDIIARRRSLLVFVEVKARERLDSACASPPPRRGWRDTPMIASAISVSMPCWWRRAVFRVISPRPSTPAADAVG